MIIPVIALGLLAGCAMGPQMSYVAPLSSPRDPAILADGICQFVSTQLPAAQTALALEPTRSNALTPLLESDLRGKGYLLATAGAANAPPGAHTLRYLVGPLFGGDVVQIDIDHGHTRSARFYVRNTAGYVQPGGPFTVIKREGQQ